jgi:hypothetical protein
MTSSESKPFLREHSLSLSALGVVLLLILLYIFSDPSTHMGSFFGNAIADWTGVLVTVVMTKYLSRKRLSRKQTTQGKTAIQAA